MATVATSPLPHHSQSEPALSHTEGSSDWLPRWRPTSHNEFQFAECSLLNTFLRNPWRTERVVVGHLDEAGQAHFYHSEVASAAPPEEHAIVLHTVVVEPKDKALRGDLVMCHGYGAGVGFWYRNLDELADSGLRVFAIDWLGMGRSSRIPFLAPEETDERVDYAEDFFLHSFEAWRRKLSLERFVLLGHSLGGYLACRYTERHPAHVLKLILASPAGVPPPPEKLMLPSHYSAGRRLFVKCLLYVWSWRLTPQTLVRAAGPLGPSLVGRFARMRFPLLSEQELALVSQYLYHTCASNASSEHALHCLLAPGAYAFRPLCHTIEAVTAPILFLYGESDWMNYRPAEELRSKMPNIIDVVRIPDSGHHLYMENASLFNSEISKFALDL
mmetsp:Transcript_28786/g.72444  ORF Transcript_28786/g.72444 Transcript_28786/m.72444 type:complete len:387 (-) Transcript_28786:132-1292(-)